MTFDPLDLLASLVLDNGQRWGDIATEWQWDCARTVLDPNAPPNRWESRPRGGSKTTDMAALAIVMLVAVLPAASECHAYARDLDQAKRIRDFIAGFVQRTPGLASELKVDRYLVTGGSGSTLTIESADAASAFGQVSAFTIVDELCQWPSTDNSRALWTAISTGMGKWRGEGPKTKAKLVVITTSGDPGSWSHARWKHAKRSKLWTVQDVPGPLEWSDADFIEDQRLDLPPSVFARMHENRWVQGEDRLTTEDDLEACITLEGPMGYVEGRRYIVTGDFGWIKDRAVVSVLHTEPMRNDTGEIRGHRVVLDQMRVWDPKRGQVRASDFQAQIAEWTRVFRSRALVDPREMVQTIQDLRDRGVDIEQYTFSSTSVGNLGLALYQAIKSHRLAIWRDQELVDEVLGSKLIENSIGSYRLEHDHGKHNDRVTTLALGVVGLAGYVANGGPVIFSDAEWSELLVENARMNGEATSIFGDSVPPPAREGWSFSGDTSLAAAGLDDESQDEPGADLRGKVGRSPWAQ